MDIQVIVSQMAALFIVIAVGYIAGKVKMLNRDGVRTLSKIVINISTPCAVLSSVLGDTSSITGSGTAYFLLLAVIAHALFYLVAIPSARALGVEKKHRGLYITMIACGNVGFMGYPVVTSIFGIEIMYYAVLFNIVFNSLLYSLGIIMISGKSDKVDLKLLINAPFIAAMFSFVVVFTGFRTPAVITDAVKLISGLNSPCAMLVIGATLSFVPIKSVFTKWRLYPVTLIKLVLLPIVSWLVFRQFVTNELFLGILVVLSAMPMAAVVPMIALEYDSDAEAATGNIFLTTLLSGATIPLIVYLLL